MKGVIGMDDAKRKTETAPNRLMELMMLNILQKHGISKESVKGKVSDEQKQLIFDLLEELKQQSNALVEKTKEQE